MILHGLVTTFEISAIATACAFSAALAFFALGLRFRPAARAVTALIDLMRCVPFLLFLYLIYYGLPAWHITLDPLMAGIVSLTLYNAAYFAELLRAAWVQIPHEQIEAGHAFGYHGLRLLRRIIFKPLFMIALPTLGNQTIQIIKDSAFLVIITVEELTYSANELQATYYIPFASFVCAGLLYWMLCLIVEFGVRASLRHADLIR
ncbi:amino acid ABC transporter permease [Acidiphilium sp.]|uniref:amino acid ABC transporter permease n=1 Tax=Acidiphilium sp. TaxID=527 RepID=UPI003D087BD6